jgi:peptidoglycan/xylan/chitin deacetylase (PgdA/CDA1 family)
VGRATELTGRMPWRGVARGAAGGVRGRARLRRSHGVRVLMYHGVVETRQHPQLERNFSVLADFREQVALLRRLPVLPGMALADPRGLPRRGVVVTFDDGMANNVLAAEVLAEAGIPWTLFVTTGTIEGPPLWTTELSLLLLEGQGGGPSVRSLNTEWDISDRAARSRTFDGLRALLKAVPHVVRRRELASLRNQFPVGELDRLLAAWPSLAMLDWSQVAQLDRAGVEIGAHGVEHVLLVPGEDPDLVAHECDASRAALEARLGHAIGGMAYPNGDTNAFARRAVRSAGYSWACTTVDGTVGHATDPWSIPRILPGVGANGLTRALTFRRT